MVAPLGTTWMYIRTIPSKKANSICFEQLLLCPAGMNLSLDGARLFLLKTLFRLLLHFSHVVGRHSLIRGYNIIQHCHEAVVDGSNEILAAYHSPFSGYRREAQASSRLTSSQRPGFHEESCS